MSSSDSSSLRFCPFCHEAYEDESHCPAHDLPLVPLDRAFDSNPVSYTLDSKLPLYEWRLGRGWIALGSLCIIVGFLLPCFAYRVDVGTRFAVTALAFATHKAPSLWMIPCAAVSAVVILIRRRTPMRMQQVRLGIMFLYGLALSSLVYSAWRVWQGSVQLYANTGIRSELSWRWGLIWVLCGIALGLWGSGRLGLLRKSPSLP